MRKLLYTLAILFAGFSIQSCSLHDDTDLFGQSAAERLEASVKADKELLESAANGWVLHYYAGENYSGGGYTFLCKFENGKVTVAGDIAGNPSATARSSYDVIKDRGPVLTFNTYNEIMHQLAKPSQSDIDGEQGDYEFVIQETSNDSICLKGKKWGNKMVMTRMPEGESWTSYLTKIQNLDEAISYNNKVLVGNDSIAYLSIDNMTRRVTMTLDSIETESAYYVTPTGIHLQQPLSVNGKELQNLTYDETHKTLTPDNLQGIVCQAFTPDGYMPLKFWEGDWQIVYAVPGNDGKPSSQYAALPLTLKPYNASYLEGVVTISNVKYTMYFEYDRHYGCISLFNQYIEDPSNTYPYLMVAPLSFLDGGYFNFKGTLLAKWNASKNRALFEFDGVGSYKIDSYILLAADESGQPLYEGEGDNQSLIQVATMPYLAGMQRPQ